MFVLTVSIHPRKEGNLNVARTHTLSYNSLLQRPVPEERLGLSQICLFSCGKESELKCLKFLP